MVIERENNDIIIRISEGEGNLDIKELQEILDYIIYRRLVTKSKATQDQIDELAKEVNKAWWSENKDRFLSQ